MVDVRRKDSLDAMLGIILIFQFMAATAYFFLGTFYGLVFGVELYLILLNFLFGLLMLSIAVGAGIAVSKSIPSLWLPFFTFLALELFIGVFSICSVFVRTPPYLHFMDCVNWRDPPRWFFMYLTLSYRQPNEPLEGGAAIFLALFFAVVLLAKSYLVKCAWVCYMCLKDARSEEKQVHVSTVKLPEKGLLPPSNEETEALPDKEPPPPACSC